MHIVSFTARIDTCWCCAGEIYTIGLFYRQHRCRRWHFDETDVYCIRYSSHRLLSWRMWVHVVSCYFPSLFPVLNVSFAPITSFWSNTKYTKLRYHLNNVLRYPLNLHYKSLFVNQQTLYSLQIVPPQSTIAMRYILQIFSFKLVCVRIHRVK